MRRRTFLEEDNLKRMIYAFSITLVISIVAFGIIFIMYNRKLREESNSNLLNLSQESIVVENDNISETSITSDKGKNETNTVTNTKSNNTKKEAIDTTPVPANVDIPATETIPQETAQPPVELKFIAPVSGDIIKDFAIDTLIYSNTLEEWTTHPGIDVAANRTSIVVAAEMGTVETIKNDPRYGITVTIAHLNGFKTVYSNLLTTEFVSEGSVVEKGQTIATVGDTASFEVADETHLHFEMYKDGTLVNPTIYLK